MNITTEAEAAVPLKKMAFKLAQNERRCFLMDGNDYTLLTGPAIKYDAYGNEVYTINNNGIGTQRNNYQENDNKQ